MDKHNLDIRKDAILMLLGSIPKKLMDESQKEGLRNTPERVAKMYDEIFGGYMMEPEQILSATFETMDNDMVIVKDIPFYSHCEHHMVPFHGSVHVGYIPCGVVVGLSKIARLVECFARRLQIQERLTRQIADSFWKYIQPKGVHVIVEAEHLCMGMRGVQKPGTITITAAVRGVFKKNPATRNEFLQLLKL